MDSSLGIQKVEKMDPFEQSLQPQLIWLICVQNHLQNWSLILMQEQTYQNLQLAKFTHVKGWGEYQL